VKKLPGFFQVNPTLIFFQCRFLWNQKCK